MDTWTQLDTGHFTKDGITIPDDMENRDRQALQAQIDANPATAQIVAFTLDLASLKRVRKNEVNSKTDELIGDGFDHDPVSGADTVHFSVNPHKERRALALNQARIAGLDMTDKKFRADGRGYVFESTADFDAWFAVGFGRIETIIDDGSDLKDDIEDAVDVPAVNAIIDART